MTKHIMNLKIFCARTKRLKILARVNTVQKIKIGLLMLNKRNNINYFRVSC